MKYKVLIRPEVEADLTHIYRWYEEHSAGLGADFLRTVDANLISIQRYPSGYPIIHKQVRRSLLRRFPYSLFYLAHDDTIVVLACFHAKRDPRKLKLRF